MKNILLNFIATIVLALLLSQFLPWWSVMISGFAAALFIRLRGIAIFLVPFMAIGLLWISQAYWLGQANDFILSKKIAQLLPLQGNIFLLILITGLIGGIAGGVAGIFAKQCHDLFSKNSNKNC